MGERGQELYEDLFENRLDPAIQPLLQASLEFTREVGIEYYVKNLPSGYFNIKPRKVEVEVVGAHLFNAPNTQELGRQLDRYGASFSEVSFEYLGQVEKAAAGGVTLTGERGNAYVVRAEGRGLAVYVQGRKSFEASDADEILEWLDGQDRFQEEEIEKLYIPLLTLADGITLHADDNRHCLVRYQGGEWKVFGSQLIELDLPPDFAKDKNRFRVEKYRAKPQFELEFPADEKGCEQALEAFNQAHGPENQLVLRRQDLEKLRTEGAALARNGHYVRHEGRHLNVYRARDIYGRLDYGRKAIHSMIQRVCNTIGTPGEAPAGGPEPAAGAEPDFEQWEAVARGLEGLDRKRMMQLLDVAEKGRAVRRLEKRIVELVRAADGIEPGTLEERLETASRLFGQYREIQARSKRERFVDTRRSPPARRWPLAGYGHPHFWAWAGQGGRLEQLYDWSQAYIRYLISTQYRPVVDSPLLLLYGAFAELREAGYAPADGGRWMNELAGQAIECEQIIARLYTACGLEPGRGGAQESFRRLLEAVQARQKLLEGIGQALETLGEEPVLARTVAARAALYLYALNRSWGDAGREAKLLERFEKAIEGYGLQPQAEEYLQAVEQGRAACGQIAGLMGHGKNERLELGAKILEFLGRFEKESPVAARVLRAFHEELKNQVSYKEGWTEKYEPWQIAAPERMLMGLMMDLKAATHRPELAGELFPRLKMQDVQALAALLYPSEAEDRTLSTQARGAYSRPAAHRIGTLLSPDALGRISLPELAEALRGLGQELQNRTRHSVSDQYYQAVGDYLRALEGAFGTPAVRQCIFHRGQDVCMNKSVEDQRPGLRKTAHHAKLEVDLTFWLPVESPEPPDEMAMNVRTSFTDKRLVVSNSVPQTAGTGMLHPMKNAAALGVVLTHEDICAHVGEKPGSAGWEAFFRFERRERHFVELIEQAATSSGPNPLKIADVLSSHFTYSRGSAVLTADGVTEVFPDVMKPKDRFGDAGQPERTEQVEKIYMSPEKAKIDFALKSDVVFRRNRQLSMTGFVAGNALFEKEAARGELKRENGHSKKNTALNRMEAGRKKGTAENKAPRQMA